MKLATKDFFNGPQNKQLEEEHLGFKIYEQERDGKTYYAAMLSREDDNCPFLWLHSDGRLYTVLERESEGDPGSGVFTNANELKLAMVEYDGRLTGWVKLESMEQVEYGGLYLIKRIPIDSKFVACRTEFELGVCAQVQIQRQTELVYADVHKHVEAKAIINVAGTAVITSDEELQAHPDLVTYYKDVDLT